MKTQMCDYLYFKKYTVTSFALLLAICESGCISNLNQMRYMDSEERPSVGSDVAAGAADVALLPVYAAVASVCLPVAGIVYVSKKAAGGESNNGSHDYAQDRKIIGEQFELLKNKPETALEWNAAEKPNDLQLEALRQALLDKSIRFNDDTLRHIARQFPGQLRSAVYSSPSGSDSLTRSLFDDAVNENGLDGASSAITEIIESTHMPDDVLNRIVASRSPLDANYARKELAERASYRLLSDKELLHIFHHGKSINPISDARVAERILLERAAATPSAAVADHQKKPVYNKPAPARDAGH